MTKKSYKNGELEKEFEKFKFYHKVIVVQGYIKAKPEELENNVLLQKYNDLEGTLQEKMDDLFDIFEASHKKHDDKDLDEIYNYCWVQIVDKLPESANYKGSIK